MAGYQPSARVWSLVRSLLAQDFVPPPDRGGFSSTRRTPTSFLSNSGRTVTESPTNGAFSAQSEGTFADTGVMAGTYVAEFKVDALSSTRASIGVANESTFDTGGTASYFGYGAQSDTLPFVAGDVIGVAFGVDRANNAIYTIFKNGSRVADLSTAGLGNVSQAHFVVASESTGSGHFQVTVESRLDVMQFGEAYAAILATATLFDWPAVSPEADGFPPAPAPPPPAPAAAATFDALRSPQGTLSGGDKIITSAATAGEKAEAIGQGSINQGDPFATVINGYAVEFTVGAVVPANMTVAIVGGSANGNPYSSLFSDVKFQASGSYHISSTVTGTSTAWSPGDKIALVQYFNKVAFFRNGAHIAHDTMSTFDFSSPWRFATEAVSDGTAVSMSVECDVAAMTYGSTYVAWRDTALSSHGDALSWPAAGV